MADGINKGANSILGAWDRVVLSVRWVMDSVRWVMDSVLPLQSSPTNSGVRNFRRNLVSDVVTAKNDVASPVSIGNPSAEKVAEVNRGVESETPEAKLKRNAKENLERHKNEKNGNGNGVGGASVPEPVVTTAAPQPEIKPEITPVSKPPVSINIPVLKDIFDKTKKTPVEKKLVYADMLHDSHVRDMEKNINDATLGQAHETIKNLREANKNHIVDFKNMKDELTSLEAQLKNPTEPAAPVVKVVSAQSKEVAAVVEKIEEASKFSGKTALIAGGAVLAAGAVGLLFAKSQQKKPTGYKNEIKNSGISPEAIAGQREAATASPQMSV